MACFHVHVGVADLESSIAFYSAVFGAPPSAREHDYAKWQLDDPKVNFAISTRARRAGLDHLGVQAESAAELDAMESRLQAAGVTGVEQEGATCCYARSDKYWVQDPAGIAWETFHTLDTAPTFNDAGDVQSDAGSCCVPNLSGCC